MSEYYAVTGDESEQEYRGVMSGMLAITLHANYIDWLCSCLSNGYSDEVAELLRAEGSGLPFTPESFVQDMQHLAAMERNNKPQYDLLQRQLEDMQKRKGGTSTPDDKYKSYLTSIFHINKHAGYAAITMESTVYEYAIAVSEYKKHCALLEKQANKK